MIVPLAVGNALRVFLEPPAGARRWRILRKAADTFTGQDDPNAFLVYEGDERSALDSQHLQNGTLYHYRAYYWDGAAWTPSATATGTPNSTYEDCSTDVLTVLRDRLALGLQAEVKRGTLRAKDGAIKVLVATPIFEQTRFPVVSVHLLSESPAERGVGELIVPDFFDDDDWNEHEGWLAGVQIAFIAWSLNPDERIALRKALRRIIVANLPVFDANGFVKVEIAQQDVDAVSGEYPAPVFQAAGTFNCLAPVIVRDQVDPITDVQLEVNTP
ncbi:hypothetical protein [Bordetella phage vB_BbrM_PHB04]|uniref:Uncharacterized protein n=1 Tax=Bordetella phage vB_BbrM_PHB04 TaxID=2029657 RepID=A0A291L9V8_9CAUD|nr:hypothetical protein HOS14_gp014 [Bordetella phage vB_BbrM_PHB04]ATI15632.1 hypothetical protein [Bordetella phage vB_BbrM_PHB04]